jgi:hypothetical protein
LRHFFHESVVLVAQLFAEKAATPLGHEWMKVMGPTAAGLVELSVSSHASFQSQPSHNSAGEQTVTMQFIPVNPNGGI